MIAATRQSANEVSQRLTGRNYISFSALSLYQQCPLRYFFKYIQGLPERVVSCSLVFGAAIHASVEYHFRELLIGKPAPDLTALLIIYQEAWRAREQDEIRFGKGESVANLAQLLTLRKFSEPQLR